MNYATITTKNGTTWGTNINGSEESIKKYFMNKYVNVGTYPKEKMEKVVKVKVEMNVK